MNLPFTPDQFFDVFGRYNQAVWPMQVVLNALALVCVVLVFRRRAPAGRVVSAILAFLWLWMAAAYHFAFFSAVNPAAWLFGAVFVVEALLFVWFGVVRGKLGFQPFGGLRGVLGAALIGYALVVYPVLGYFIGHRFPRSPTFGLPCPTTIFTVGVLLFAARPVPRVIYVVPIAWAAVGSLAAFQLGVVEDLALLAAGGIAIVAALIWPPPLAAVPRGAEGEAP